jgi:putative ABC transport system permease protein
MLADILGEAVASFRAHPGRSVLTLFGIVWGMALAILLIAWGTGLRETMVEQTSSGGRRMILFFPGRSSSGVGANQGGREIKLTRDDARLVASQLPALEHVGAGTIRWGGIYVRYHGDFRHVITFGLDPEAGAIMELIPDVGRFIDAQDMVQRRRVAVLGAALKEKLFATRAAIGERIEVSGIGYRVVGVLRKKGDQISSLGPSDDDKLFLPLSTVQALVTGDDYIGFIAAAPWRVEEHTAVTAQVRKVLGKRHGFGENDRDALSVFDVVNFIDLFRNLTTAIRLFVAVLGVVSLAIGGVGVMNILLLAVSERSREIGLRKALGATQRDIVAQFLAEGLFMTGIGGLVGITLGWLLCVAAGTPGNVHVVAYLSRGVVAMSFGLIGVIGVAAGLWPALRAARIDPTRAIRFQ